MKMAILLLVLAATVYSAQSVVPSMDSRPIIAFPVKVTNAGGVCPSEQEQAEIRRQILNEALVALIPGLTENNPVTSCDALPASNPSGYYWILPAAGPPAVQVYCDFDRGSGVWTRVAFLNMSDPSENCPENWVLDEVVRGCGNPNTIMCTSTLYPAFGLPYSHVTGRIIAYQRGVTSGLYPLVDNFAPISSNYLEATSNLSCDLTCSYWLIGDIKTRVPALIRLDRKFSSITFYIRYNYTLCSLHSTLFSPSLYALSVFALSVSKLSQVALYKLCTYIVPFLFTPVS